MSECSSSLYEQRGKSERVTGWRRSSGTSSRMCGYSLQKQLQAAWSSSEKTDLKLPRSSWTFISAATGSKRALEWSLASVAKGAIPGTPIG
eukprot:2838518-Pleurochrysis_carterae.AAC.1